MKKPQLNINNLDKRVSVIYVYRAEDGKELPTDLSTYSSLIPIAKIDARAFGDMITFIDTDEPQRGITYYSHDPITIKKPKVDIDIVTSNLDDMTKIVPAAKIKVLKVNEGVIISYAIIAEDNTGNVSNLSLIKGEEIIQNLSDVTIKLQYKSKNGWVNITTLEEGIEKIVFKATDKENFFNEPVKTLSLEDIEIDNKNILSDNFSIIKIKNVWHIDNYKDSIRKLKVLKVYAYLENMISQSTEILTSVFPCEFDKLEILRKEYDGNINPVNPFEEGTEVKQVINKHGIFYSECMGNLELNPMYISTSSTVVDSDTTFKSLQIIDKGLMNGKTYKYTVRLYTRSGEVSTPFTFINAIKI